ncbi:MAG: thioredoxin family protein [Kiritimatiellae bacterium]|nr:thioredoxin family protein [Kiritimatiellia bacterium]
MGRDRIGGGGAAEPVSARAVAATPSTFAAALASAKRPVLVDCWASWCKNCAARDRVMEEPAVRDATGRYSIIRLQAEDIRELQRLEGFERVKGLPAFAVFE